MSRGRVFWRERGRVHKREGRVVFRVRTKLSCSGSPRTSTRGRLWGSSPNMTTRILVGFNAVLPNDKVWMQKRFPTGGWMPFLQFFKLSKLTPNHHHWLHNFQNDLRWPNPYDNDMAARTSLNPKQGFLLLCFWDHWTPFAETLATAFLVIGIVSTIFSHLVLPTQTVQWKLPMLKLNMEIQSHVHTLKTQLEASLKIILTTLPFIVGSPSVLTCTLNTKTFIKLSDKH